VRINNMPDIDAALLLPRDRPNLARGVAWNPVPALLENLECGQGPFWLVPPLATSKITSVTGTSLDAPFLFLLLGCYE
jgi:hypothetical protein